MSGEDLFLGMNYVKAKFIDEAETVTELKKNSAHKEPTQGRKMEKAQQSLASGTQCL